jgi:hypothetical protein|tara:strand:- start:4002 stop:4298 length:297 start_codon:yes stop_codon:yes gene_type:complete
MTLREIGAKITDIGSKIIDYDLNPLFEFVFGALLYIGMPIGSIWFGSMLLKDVFINKQPHDRDLFAKIFMTLAGFFAWGLAIFILYHGLFTPHTGFFK